MPTWDLWAHQEKKNPFMKDIDTNFKLHKSLTISNPIWVTQNSFNLNSQTWHSIITNFQYTQWCTHTLIMNILSNLNWKKKKKNGSVLSHYENELLTHSILKHNQKGHFGPKPLFDRSHPTTKDGKKAANLFWFGHHPTPKHPTILILLLFLLWYQHFG